MVTRQNEAEFVEVTTGIEAVVPDNSTAIVWDHALVASIISTSFVVDQGLTSIVINYCRPFDKGTITVAMGVDLADLLVLDLVSLQRWVTRVT